MYKIYFRFLALATFFILSPVKNIDAQYLENFESTSLSVWRTASSDGNAVSELTLNDGYASIIVNASEDIRNIWWAIMQTTVSDELNLRQLVQPDYELRIEARIRSSHAPRRVNLHLNTQRTVDFHSHLMEFDIPDTENWHTISMTTQGFDGRPGDRINAHIALMDWGRDIYCLDVDYFKVDVVNVSEADEDKGEQVLYPPPKPEPDEFQWSVPALETGMIDEQYPDVNFSGWRDGDLPVLTTDGTKTIILRWELNDFRDQTAAGYGMLELTLHSHYRTPSTGLQEFDKVRLVEILNAPVNWTRKNVTFNNFTGNQHIDSVLNTQMIIDTDIPVEMRSQLRLHIPRPVVQRMIDGKTSGIAIYPLGALHASFSLRTSDDNTGQPKLYFNLVD